MRSPSVKSRITPVYLCSNSSGVLLLHILNRLFYTGVCVESTILVCHQTQSDCPHLTGNQVTYLTSLQMLSENRLVCQETAITL